MTNGPDPILIAAIAAVVVVVAAIALSYNRFIRQRQLIRNSWSTIDTELRRRYDLIPNLVETVKGYAAHEKDLLERVTAARSAALASTGRPGEQAAAERPLVDGLRGLLAVAESYPGLKASAHFLELQRELANTEDRLAAARRFYNNNVRDYNRRVQSFPSMIMARIFSFGEEDYFEVEEALRSAGAPRAGLS
ncbi:MAG TPA: LemA family protein [Actinomycetota bacterium]